MTSAAVAPRALEQAELATLVDQLQNKQLQLENRFLELQGKYHQLALDFVKQSNAPLKFSIDALDRIAKIEAHLDSGKARPRRTSQRVPRRSVAG